jgi:hypothetical protein
MAAALLLALPLVAGTPKKDERQTLQLGEVTTPGKQDQWRVQAFRTIVHDSLRELSLPPAASGETYVLSASLVQLKSEQEGERRRAACRVSLTIRSKSEGVLRAILRGSASVSDSARSQSTESIAMRAAVKSALKRVGPALS